MLDLRGLRSSGYEHEVLAMSDGRIRNIATWILAGPLLLAVGSQAATAKDSATASSTSTAPNSKDESPDLLPAHIQRLVQQLGDKQYLVRQAAQDEICRIGPDAFDALIAAQDSSDVEISSRAQYLLQLIRIQWSHGNDGPEVAQILRDYDQSSEAGRFQKMQELAMLPGNRGVAPLCRLVRFEHLPRLSKQAALLLMGQPNPAAEQWPARVKSIETILAKCARPGAQWLRAYSQYQHDPAGASQQWQKLVEDDLASSDSAANGLPPASGFDVERRLADTLATQFGCPELSADLMRKMIPRVPSDVAAVQYLVSWFVARQSWELVEETFKHFGALFHDDAVLLESLALAERELGKSAEADQRSQQAAGLIKGDAEAHRKAALKLSRYGLFAAAEREYRQAIGQAPQETEIAMQSQFELGEMLHDQQRELEAAKVVQVMIDAAAKDDEVRKQLKAMAFPLDPIARLHYYYACHYQSHRQLAEAQQHLDQAIQQDPLDADVLISLYQTSADDPTRRRHALDLIHTADESFRAKIKDQPNEYEPYNEDAWLIGNTEGDYELAIQYSHRSIELLKQKLAVFSREMAGALDLSEEDLDRSDAGLEDTLAHCYAGSKDFESAVKYQTLAQEKDLHSLAIRRALADFQAQLEKSRRPQ
jgi:tetratricopeptide (TPR) repeat protein